MIFNEVNEIFTQAQAEAAIKAQDYAPDVVRIPDNSGTLVCFRDGGWLRVGNSVTVTIGKKREWLYYSADVKKWVKAVRT